MEQDLQLLNSEKAPLLNILRALDLTKVFVGLGACIDPDGLASQWAMERIIKDIFPSANVQKFYRGDWDRAQNRTMREVLGLTTIKPYSDVEDDYTAVIMVDGNSSVLPAKLTAVDLVIDHHDGDPGAKYSDVRKIGSCSAILWEYIIAQNPELLEGEDGAKLATALAIGIITDTNEKTVAKTSKLDWEAEAYCGIRSDIKLYSAIKNYPRPAYQKDMEMQAWVDKKKEGTTLTTNVGVIPRERKGVVSSCAEEFCGQGPVKTTMVGAMIDGDIYFSFRTLSSAINADDFIKNKITKHGGGKTGSGAGTIVMPDVLKGLPEDLQKDLFDVVWRCVSHKTFEFTGDGIRQEE